MIIVWMTGEYAHNQEYYGIGFVLNWPGKPVAYVAYDELLVADVIFSEALTAAAIMIEIKDEDVVLTETLSNEVVH